MSKTKDFPREYLDELIWCYPSDEEVDGYTILSNVLVGTSRWNTEHELVFLYEGEMWGIDYSKGATEYQDCLPFGHRNEMVECYAVEAKTKTVTYYEKVK